MKQIKIENIIDDAKKYGHEATIRDVAYSLLRSVLDNDLMCYSVVFGTPQKDNDIECYERMEKVKFLIKHFSKLLEPEQVQRPEDILASLDKNQKKDNAESVEDITFEENKAAMIELIQRTEDALAEGRIDTDKGLKIVADLRVKLNDKFKVDDKSTEQYIIVQPKFNTICQHTRKECWLQTEEYAMKHWHLIKDPNYKGD
jgi:hypothetical protein